ncbi:autotransporter assembly complex protein TamA [Neptunomonas phycophila]|uniref:autotransporter assembly complex protein TamA n=1 Tax=Neptunomonas phycophila TaxID=1572645 RepID=UPI0009F9D557|nr:autotransporter assembly complex family protein [Neptunomonas phycophila]
MSRYRSRVIVCFLVGLWAFTSNASAAKLDVVIQGVEGKVADNVKAFLTIESLNGETFTSESRVRYLNRKAEDEIRTALQPFGYYSPIITSELKDGPDVWVATYSIVPGNPIPYGKVDIAIDGAAAEDVVFKRLLASTPVKPGNPLIHSEYEGLKSQILSLAAERGYHEGEVTKSQVLVKIDSYTADVQLHFASGPRYSIGQVNFSDSPISEKLLTRYLPFEEGQAVKTSELVDLQTNLLDSDYFSRVEVRPLWSDASNQQVPIDIILEPQKRTRYEAGGGYGTDTGARVRLGVTRRWVNSLGHQLSGDVQLSQITNSASLEYAIPGQNPMTERYTINLNYEDEHSDTVDSESLSIGVSEQWQWKQWQMVTSLQYEEETYTLDGETDSSTLLYPLFSASTVSTGNRLNVKNGYRLSGQIIGGADSVLSDTNFVQVQASGKVIHSLTDQIRVLARVEAGITAADDFDKIPASHRFYAGGDTSVRGYSYQSLGPKGDDGDVVGGPNLLVGSLETDYRFTGSDWGVAAFIDMGNAYEDADLSLKTGVGFGVRWFSPIGPIRLDLGFPQNNSDDRFRIHFTLGADL